MAKIDGLNDIKINIISDNKITDNKRNEIVSAIHTILPDVGVAISYNEPIRKPIEQAQQINITKEVKNV